MDIVPTAKYLRVSGYRVIAIAVGNSVTLKGLVKVKSRLLQEKKNTSNRNNHTRNASKLGSIVLNQTWEIFLCVNRD
jgi:hypothetical protein